MTLAIVTGTTFADKAMVRGCVESWRQHATKAVLICGVVNGRVGEPDGLFDVQVHESQYLGTVAAFRRGVDLLLDFKDPPDVIACLHDDLRLDEPGWDQKVLRHFERHPSCGLLGFGGALGLGHPQIYQLPYDPMQLARAHFRSNLVDAETHGIRSLLPEKVACLDGFSQIGRRAFWLGIDPRWSGSPDDHHERPWTVLSKLGFVHHFYDGALGCLAARYGWDTWYLPLRGQHYGGQTAVGDAGYGDWAKTRHEKGDRGFWEDAHRAGYEAFRDVLPLYPRS